jgi:hypothetical protein
MKHQKRKQQKGSTLSVLVLIIAVLLILGGIFLYENSKQSSVTAPSVVATSTAETSTASTTVGVVGMVEYTDTAFGFSFWYPNTWQVKELTGSDNSTIKGGTVVKTLGIGDTDSEILIQEVHSSTLTITDTGGAGPFGPVTYSFNTADHLWMTTSVPAAGTTTPADISVNTMGGLHMFPGTSRFDSNIIPLSADDFLVIKDIGGFDATDLAKTVVAVDPSVAVPLDTASQNQTIQAEANAYGAQVSADWKTYYSSQYGFSFMYPSNWTLTEKTNKQTGLAEVDISSNLDSDIPGVPAEEIDFSTVYKSYFSPPIGTKYGNITYDDTKMALVDQGSTPVRCLPVSSLLQIPNAMASFTYSGSLMSDPAYMDYAILTKNGPIILVSDYIEGTTDTALRTNIADSFTLLNGNSAVVPACAATST